MERISSTLFCLSLLVYYIPKLLKVKKSKYVKVHVILGSISIIAMIISFITRIGQESFFKYCGFTLIMILIGITGFLMKNRYMKYRKLHILFMFSFFVYLYMVIKIL